MINQKRLLDSANSLFIQKKFDEALFLYSQLASAFPYNQEYKTYALFCDLAIEDEQKALALYDYFTIIKADGVEEAIKYVEDVLKVYDADLDKMMTLLKELNLSTVETLDAIRYEDFKKLIESRGSFRIAFEDIMFSTKVAIENRDDFYDFVTKLIDNNFNNTAYTYLDGFNEYFTYDKEIEKLYKKLEEKKLESNHK